MSSAMSSLNFPPIPSPDATIAASVRSAMVQNPRGASFGRFAAIGAWVAACQGVAPPRPVNNVQIVVFAGDHGIARRGVSAFTPDASVVQAEEIEAGAAPINTLAQQSGATVRLIDASLDRNSSESIRRSSGAIDIEDAMSPQEFDRAVALGISAADREIDSGVDLLAVGDLGVGNTTVAAAVLGALTFTEPVVAVGRGSGINDEVWKTKVAAVRDAMFRVRSFISDVPEVMRCISSPDFVALTAFIARCATRRTPMLIDGTLTAVAAYTAERLAPGTKQWLLAGQLSPEPSSMVCLQALDLTPVAALDMTTGQGAGAAAVLPLVASAVDLVREEMNAQA